ncbi:MAG: hypothetical protein ABEK17_04125 [Candidatus Aenigmatarchaeota archaeon]
MEKAEIKFNNGRVIKNYFKGFSDLFDAEAENLREIKKIQYPHIPHPFKIDYEDKKIELPNSGEDLEKVFSRKGFDKDLIEDVFTFLIEEETQYFDKLRSDRLSLKNNSDNPHFEANKFTDSEFLEEGAKKDLEDLLDVNIPSSEITYSKFDPEASNFLKKKNRIYSIDFGYMRPAERVYAPIYLAFHLDYPNSVKEIKETDKIKNEFLHLCEDYTDKYEILRNVVEVFSYHGNGLVNRPDEDIDKKGRNILGKIEQIPKILSTEDYKSYF